MRQVNIGGLVAIVAVISLAGCREGEEPRPVPTADRGPANFAATYGRLAGDAETGCLWVETGPGEPLATDGRMTVVWPQGHTALFHPVRLVGPDGEIVAEEGDQLVMSGGEGPASSFDLGACKVENDRVWVAGSVERAEQNP